MTTVPGHNIVIQSAGAAQELSHQAHSPKPSPEQAVAQQQATDVIQNTTVQEFDEAERLKLKKEKEALRRRRQKEKEKKKKSREELAMDPEATGKILDTTA